MTMKILLLNPNTSAGMTEAMTRVASAAVGPGTTLLPLTADTGFPYISSRAEAQVAGAVALDLIARHRREVDAVVIAAFGDPGLLAARELFDLPVVGMAEAAMTSALLLGQRFGFVTFTRHMRPWYEQSVAQAGLQSRFAGVRTPQAGFQSVTTVQDELFDDLRGLVQEAVDEDGADVVILAGAPLAGLAQRYTDAPAVLVDPISAAVTQAEALARLAPRGAHAGSFARPPAKPSTGLPPSLAAWIARTDG
jgi:Asp/Glu/hydantoin racemase